MLQENARGWGFEQVLIYTGLHPGKLQAKFDKVCAAIVRDDFRSIDMKKLAPTAYYRAKLDDTSRLLVQFVRYQDTTACLALEIIAHHAYEKSRFLRGATVDPARIAVTPEQATAEAQPVRYLHPGRTHFHLLDRPLSFDDTQQSVYAMAPPLILVGSAGSGKTALTLEKLRQAEGDVLYVTQSPWLAQSARGLYTAHGYENPAQQVQFLSYGEFLETLRVPSGREVQYAAFRDWFSRHRQYYRFTDAHPCFEEFRGVISSQPEGVMTREAYLALGPRQSIFEPAQREAIYALFDHEPLQDEVKRGSHHMEPKAPLTGGGEAPTERSGFFTSTARGWTTPGSMTAISSPTSGWNWSHPPTTLSSSTKYKI